MSREESPPASYDFVVRLLYRYLAFVAIFAVGYAFYEDVGDAAVDVLIAAAFALVAVSLAGLMISYRHLRRSRWEDETRD